jgi:hypothetical protein
MEAGCGAGATPSGGRARCIRALPDRPAADFPACPTRPARYIGHGQDLQLRHHLHGRPPGGGQRRQPGPQGDRQRYDFKGATAEIEFDRGEGTLKLLADDEYKLKALVDVLESKLFKRGVPIRNLDYGEVETASRGKARQVITLQQGISTEKGKEIVKAIKAAGFKKVNAQIQDEQVRVHLALHRRAPGGDRHAEEGGLRAGALLRQLPLVGRPMHRPRCPLGRALPPRVARSPPAASTRPCAPSAPWAASRSSWSAGAGSRLWDVDGNEYIDYVLSWGPLILGHAHPAVVHAVLEAAARGTSYGAPTEAEVELAEAVRGFFPSMEQAPLRQQRHRGHHVGAPAGAGAHRARPGPQVRGVLPRPRRLLPGEGRLRRRDPRPPRLARRAGALSRLTSPRRSTTWRRWSGLPRAPRADRRA